MLENALLQLIIYPYKIMVLIFLFKEFMLESVF